MIYTPYIWPNLLAFAIPMGFAVYMARFRDVPAARPFSVLMILTSLWTSGHILNISTNLLPLRVFWGQLQVVPFACLPLAILMMVLEYIGQAHWLTRSRQFLLASIPVITILLAWTSAFHTFYRYDFALDFSGPVPVLLSSKGFWYWVSLGYTYLLILVACILLLISFPVRTPYFGNALVIGCGVTLPFFVDLLYTRGITPVPGYNPAPITFIFTGALQLWAILRWRMFDLIPIARETMLEQMQEGMVVIDDQQRIVEINPAAAKILGGSRASLIGQPLRLDIPGSDFERLTQVPLEASTTTGQLLELAIGACWYQASSLPLRNLRQTHPSHLIMLRDITALKQAQANFVEQQRALAMMEERVRLARELHDGLGQVVGYVKMRAQVARDLLSQGQVTTVDAYLANLVDVTQEAHTDIREYLVGVRTTTAANSAFVGALQQYLRQFSHNYGIQVEFNAPPDLNSLALSPTAEAQLLRIVQEALTNTRKYAQSTRVQISLAIQGHQVDLVVQDDGIGFDPAKPANTGPSFGLCFMRERAEQLNGHLEVQSTPGQGTRLIVRVPLNTANIRLEVSSQ